jgi:hypothetical protein
MNVLNNIISTILISTTLLLSTTAFAQTYTLGEDVSKLSNSEKLSKTIEFASMSNAEFEKIIKELGMDLVTDKEHNFITGKAKDGSWMISKKNKKEEGQPDLVYSNKRNEDENILKGAVFLDSELGPNNIMVNNYETPKVFISTMHSPSDNNEANWYRYFIQIK